MKAIETTAKKSINRDVFRIFFAKDFWRIWVWFFLLYIIVIVFLKG